MNNCLLYTPSYCGMPASCCGDLSREALFNFFRKYLLQKAISVYKWDAPEEWNIWYMLYHLYIWGYVSVIYTIRFGWIPQRCSLYGYDIWDAPDRIRVDNAIVNGIDRKIGDKCVLFKMDGTYTGIMDLVDVYAGQLAELFVDIKVNAQTSRMAFVFSASDKKEAETQKKLYDNVLDGEVAVFTKQNASGTWEYFSQNIGQNYIIDKLLVDIRKILNAFNSEIGIPNTNTEKKERMNTDEVNSNNGDTKVRAAMWLEEFQKTCSILNKIAGRTILTVNWRKEVKDSEPSSSINTIRDVQI